MITPLKIGLTIGATVLGAAYVCPLCDDTRPPARAQEISVAGPGPDTATVRLHISRMTCGSCPATARLALKRVPGVYSVTVTLDDSLGVVRYDPRRVSPHELAAQLTRFTGFGATVVPDSITVPRQSAGD